MIRRLTAASVMALLLMLSAGSAHASAANEATYAERAKGPLAVAGSPTAVIATNQGTGYENLGVLSGPEGVFEFFANQKFGKLVRSSRTALPAASVFSDSIGTFGDDRWPIKAFSHPQDGTVSVTRRTEARAEERLLGTFQAGPRPSSATVVSSAFNRLLLPIDLALLAVTDETANRFSYLNATDSGLAETVMSTPVGQQPVAADSFNEIFWFTANRGSNDVSIIRIFAGDGYPDPYMEVVQTVPVGDAPVDLVNIDRRGPEQMIAVANRDSGTVSILGLIDESTGRDMRVVQEIEVGSLPTSVIPVRVNRDRLVDLAVTNSGSNDVSILINEGNERFSHGQRVKVGKRPVAATAINLNRYFSGDLAVANSGDGTVSLLLKNPGTGKCFGKPAWTVTGTETDDDLWGSRDPDVTSGFGGNDTIRSGLGYDCLYGGSGRDEIFGGFANDRVFGGSGRDKLSGFNGNDLIQGGPGDDYICDSGQRYGRYECYGDRPFVIFRDYLPDRDRIFGGTGDDRITVGPKADIVRAGSGDDLIDARDTVRDVIACGPGRDVVEADLKDRVRDCERVLLPEV